MNQQDWNRVKNRTHRRGFTYLEVQTAFAVLGLALAGMAPVVASQLRLVRKIELRLDPNSVQYLIPVSDPWVRKLGASAIRTTDSTQVDSYGMARKDFVSSPNNQVTLDMFTTSTPNDTASAVVTIASIEGTKP